jgi:putative membrane protein
MMGFGLIFIALFIGGVIVLALAIGTLINKDGSSITDVFSGRKTRSPRDILAERYARGEITREEFETMKADIEKKG